MKTENPIPKLVFFLVNHIYTHSIFEKPFCNSSFMVIGEGTGYLIDSPDHQNVSPH